MTDKTKWRKCDHPRTPENTCGVSVHKPGGQCRACRRPLWRAEVARYRRTEKGRISNILRCMRYRNKLADARDERLLQQLRGETSATQNRR